jgi:phage tail protein X
MTTYSTLQGDTFDIVSLRLLGDEAYAGQIANLNPAHAHIVIFNAGVMLNIPSKPETSQADNLPPWRREL